MKRPYVRWAAMILALLCFSIAAYFCGKIYYTEKEYAEGDAVYEDILADVVISEEEVLGESSEPTSETGEQVEETDEGVQAEESLVPEIDFVSLKEINEDVVGWLYLPDTVINYPVVQGEDNSYYLKHLVDGSYNANGSLFVCILGAVKTNRSCIGNLAFYNCNNLKSITIGNGVTSIGNGAFYNCCSFTSIIIPDSVTSIGWSAFSGCTSLTSIVIPNSVNKIDKYAFLYTSDKLVIICAKNSAVDEYAKKNEITVEYLN